MAKFDSIALGLLVLTLAVFGLVEWIRQEFAIAMYWTDKQREGYRQRKRTGK